MGVKVKLWNALGLGQLGLCDNFSLHVLDVFCKKSVVSVGSVRFTCCVKPFDFRPARTTKQMPG